MMACHLVLFITTYTVWVCAMCSPVVAYQWTLQPAEGLQPMPRIGFSMEVCSGFIYIWGGRHFNGTHYWTLNEMWRFHYSAATVAWESMPAVNVSDSGLTFSDATTAVIGNQLFSFGGFLYPGGPDFANTDPSVAFTSSVEKTGLWSFNTEATVWVNLTGLPGEPELPRGIHGMTSIGNVLWVYGGGPQELSALDQGDKWFVFALDTGVQPMVWRQWAATDATGARPPSQWVENMFAVGDSVFAVLHLDSGPNWVDSLYKLTTSSTPEWSSVVEGVPGSARFGNAFTALESGNVWSF
eukprot:CAMPEP_0173435134 /NCGR_PEP_ID=MMETSP1357-20121228/14290_1 /TAXON_ID=77926 /ORGANISM="Hemiselmis rufescens, Strain PCC563" /LENGTH=296 /DNA_ID=CAMNT_0014400081 /DNA_START=406 /DNA_END=1296 /DNA_ORIENTATION=+